MSKVAVAVSLSVLLALAACRTSTPVDHPQSATAADTEFEKFADAYYWAHYDFRPNEAVEQGWHQYDGKLPDRSPAAIAKEIARLHAAAATLDGFAAKPLSHEHQLEREVLVYLTRSERFSV